MNRAVGEERCSHIFSGLTGHEIRFGTGGSCYVINSLFFFLLRQITMTIRESLGMLSVVRCTFPSVEWLCLCLFGRGCENHILPLFLLPSLDSEASSFFFLHCFVLFAFLVLEFPWDGLGVGFLFRQKSPLKNGTRLVGVRGGRDDTCSNGKNTKTKARRRQRETISELTGGGDIGPPTAFQPSKHRDGII